MSMYFENRNIYQKARETAGLTQEAVAELLAVSVESIRAYESGVRLPKNTVVDKMAVIFHTDWLPIQHLLLDELAGKYLPKPQVGFTLSQATLWFIKELETCRTLTPRLVEITYSNMLQTEQKAEFDELMQGFFLLAGAVLTLQFCDKGVSYGKSA